jgi:hypothetical protein
VLFDVLSAAVMSTGTAASKKKAAKRRKCGPYVRLARLCGSSGCCEVILSCYASEALPAGLI